MDEYLDVLNEIGEETGVKKLRSEIHRDGDWHASVHVWIVSGRDVLIQKRSKSKESFPGQYDVSASGHVLVGEQPLVSASRELFEETGIAVDPIEFTIVTTQKLVVKDEGTGFLSREINHVYAVFYTPDYPQIRITETDEISELRWVNIDELGERIKRDNSNYCIPPAEWEEIWAFRA